MRRMNNSKIIQLLELRADSEQSSIGLPANVVGIELKSCGCLKISRISRLRVGHNAGLTKRGLLVLGSSGCGDRLAVNFRSQQYSVELDFYYEYGFDADRTNAEGFVHPHAGLHGEGDLSVKSYGFTDKVAKVVIKRAN